MFGVGGGRRGGEEVPDEEEVPRTSLDDREEPIAQTEAFADGIGFAGFEPCVEFGGGGGVEGEDFESGAEGGDKGGVGCEEGDVADESGAEAGDGGGLGGSGEAGGERVWSVRC